MSEVNLETQVKDLTARLVQAEEQIKQLLQLTSSFRNELLEQRKIIKELSSGKSKDVQGEPLQPAELQSDKGNYGIAGKNGIAGTLQVQSLDENWEFNDDMEIDWDALDVLNINTLPEENTTETAVTTTTITTTAPAPHVPPLR